MRRVCMALVLVAAIPLGARAEPISVNLQGSTGAVHSGDVTTGFLSINLGQVSVGGGESTSTFFFSGMQRKGEYNVLLDLSSLTGLQSLKLELFDPLNGDDRLDTAQSPGYAPAGYTTSNDVDGFSFAQGAGLERSATFAGGSLRAVADEMSHRGDILLFSGLNGADDARVAFGLRDWRGQRGFLLRITATSLDAAHSPEPASMLLLGTGLAGIAGAYRRRKQARA